MTSKNAIGPKLRNGNFRKETAIKRFIQTLEDADYMQNCLVCTHFNEQTEFCAKFQARPPARVIAYACPDFSDNDDIPF